MQSQTKSCAKYLGKVTTDETDVNAADSDDDLIDLDQASSLLKPIFYAEDWIIIYDANSARCKRHVI